MDGDWRALTSFTMRGSTGAVLPRNCLPRAPGGSEFVVQVSGRSWHAAPVPSEQPQPSATLIGQASDDEQYQEALDAQRRQAEGFQPVADIFVVIAG